MSDASAARHPGHTRIDNRIITDYAPRLGPIPLAVYVALASFANCDTRQCYPSISTLARLVRVSYPTAQKAIRALEAAGLIRAQPVRDEKGNRRPHLYTLLPVGGGQAPCAGVRNDVEEGTQSALEEQHLTNKGDAGAGAPRARPQPRAVNLDHPAVKAYRGICRITPNDAQRAQIAAAVTDMTRWTATLNAWLMRGYNPRNVAGMLEWYDNGIPQRSVGSGGNAKGGQFGFAGNRGRDGSDSRGGETPEEAARLDAEWQQCVSRTQGRRGGRGA